jgi:Protein of unknown function (DUF3800)
MVFQLYVDDSSDNSRMLILAGYIATAENWAKFSDEWQEILDMRRPYPLKAYHAAERGNSDEEREREIFLFRVIERYVQGGVAFGIPTAKLKYFGDLYGLSKWDRNPYNLALSGFSAILDGALKVLKKPIDLIFDERKEASHVIEGYSIFTGHLRPDLKKWLRSPPSFKSDEDVLPLQAADMLAYYALQNFRRTGQVTADGVWPWEVKNPKLIACLMANSINLRKIVRSLASTPFPTKPKK